MVTRGRCAKALGSHFLVVFWNSLRISPEVLPEGTAPPENNSLNESMYLLLKIIGDFPSCHVWGDIW